VLHILLGFARGVDALNHRIGKSLGWLLVLTVFVSAYNAVVRKAFNISSNSLLEIQWYLFGAVFLLGAAYTLQQNAHVRIDILAQHFSARTQIVLELLGYVLFLLPLVAFMLVFGGDYFWRSWVVQETSPDVGGLWRWPAKLFIVIGFALLGLQLLSELIKKTAMLRGHLPMQRIHGEKQN
jgi:TRAP-type mannitol/chloroaromatic compound transport system permease small subunit